MAGTPPTKPASAMPAAAMTESPVVSARRVRAVHSASLQSAKLAQRVGGIEYFLAMAHRARAKGASRAA